MCRRQITNHSLKPREDSDQGRRRKLDGRLLHGQQLQVVLSALASLIARIIWAARRGSILMVAAASVFICVVVIGILMMQRRIRVVGCESLACITTRVI